MPRFPSLAVADDPPECVDVPPAMNSTGVYCATLGHKANHSFTNNCIYEPCWHPRFGHIKMLRAVRGG